jgi:hypothetical protein
LLVVVYLIGVIGCFLYFTIGQYPNNPDRRSITISPLWPLFAVFFVLKLSGLWFIAVIEDVKEFFG